jgi:excisionase family DNA binding protein
MEQEYYTAKEVAAILKKSTRTVYRDAQNGELPSIGKRPNIRFPKEAIDILAEVNLQNEDSQLSFSTSTIAESWVKRELNRPYESEDTVPFKTVLEWRKRNNDIAMNLRRGKNVLGWVTFLPLDEEVALNLIYGRIREKDIPPQTVKKWSDPQLSIYIPVIEVISSNDLKKDRAIGAELIKRTIKWAISITIQYDIKNWYAVGTTPNGQDLLEKLEFQLLTTQDEGRRKGYILETSAQPMRLISKFAENMDKGNDLLQTGKKH